MLLATLHDGPEVFAAPQGEGPTAGTPSVFVRAARCNLHCVWCDTEYTWNWRGTPHAHRNDADPAYAKYDREAETVELNPAAVAAAVARHAPRNVVLTGGEPLLQQPAWVELIDTLRDADPAYRFEVETNGTITPTPDLAERIDQWNVSPKLANSGNAVTIREVADALQWFAHSDRAWWKFVLAGADELPEVLDLIETFGAPANRVVLMPEGVHADVLDARQAELAPLCEKHGFTLGDRLHIREHGDARGT